MADINVLCILRTRDADRERIAGLDPRITCIDAGGWFDGEIRETWPPFTSARYLSSTSNGSGTRAERDRLLADADIILGGWPFPLDLRARSPRLKWFHQRPAGASNLLRGDLWGSDVVVTTSRGAGNTLAIAEYAVTGLLHLAKGFPQIEVERRTSTFDFRAYRPLLIHGKTVCVVGAGGIGRDVGRLCAGVGMRVIGTRRTPEAGPLPPGFSEISGPEGLERMLAESDFVIICCHWTPETHHLFNAQRFAAMKPGAILVNVASGEIIDEDALVSALAANTLRGAVLDVYDGEFERPPRPELWSDPRVLITPHVSGQSDRQLHAAIDVFCENLKAWLDGRPMLNVIDWKRGY